MSEHRLKGVIKATPECFVVQELFGPQTTPVPLHTETSIMGFNPASPITLFHLVKKGVSSDDAMREVAKQLNVWLRDISNHGMKDKYAYTAQRIGVRGAFRPQFAHPDIVLRQVGSLRSKLALSGHKGNRFTILVLSDATTIDIKKLNEFRNVFGQQRFGTPRGYEVGKMLLEGRFVEAFDIESNNGSRSRIQRIRSRSNSWEELFFGSEFVRESEFRIMQWQSYLWNTLVNQLENAPDRLPVWSPQERSVYEHLWNPKVLDPVALRLLYGYTRRTVIRPKNISAERMHAGWEIRFDIPPGAYATVALSQIFELSEHRFS